MVGAATQHSSAGQLHDIQRVSQHAHGAVPAPHPPSAQHPTWRGGSRGGSSIGSCGGNGQLTQLRHTATAAFVRRINKRRHHKPHAALGVNSWRTWLAAGLRRWMPRARPPAACLLPPTGVSARPPQSRHLQDTRVTASTSNAFIMDAYRYA